MNWIKPNTITGSVAQGAKYFRREDIELKIWHEINNGNYVLFLAPRRVGKSSIVSFMALNPTDGFVCKYEDIESDNSIQDFYKRLCRMIQDAITVYGKNKQLFINWWNGWTLKSIGKENVEIGKEEINYRDAFLELLNELKDNQEKIVLILDEFPDVVLKIFKHKGIQEAEQLLTDVRTLSHNDDFKSVFNLVLLGSIGLSHIVKQITGRKDKINHFHKEYLPTLNNSNANDFIEFLVKDATIQISNDTRNYLLTKIGHFIPYYIQLVIEECDELLFNELRPDLTIEDVDIAYTRLIKKNEHFNDWDWRLSKYFPDKYKFLIKVLAQCAYQSKISLIDIYNLAEGFNLENEWKADIDDILVADGYIYEDENQDYYFNSPLLRDWWKLRHPIMK